MAAPLKPSYFYCDLCRQTFVHGTWRYTCTICSDHDQCYGCTTTKQPPHPHPLVPELAFGAGEDKPCGETSMRGKIYQALEMYTDRHCLGVRDVDPERPGTYANSYTWLTYKAVGERALNFGSGLRQLIEPRGYLTIGASSRPEWVVADWACMFHDIVTVPIYTLTSDHDTAFMIKNTAVSVVVCDQETLPKFLRLHAECPSLRHIICMDSLDPTTLETPAGITVHEMSALETRGSQQPCAFPSKDPSSCTTIIYTSGSSGSPKGVMISDRAWLAVFPQHPMPETGETIILSYQSLSWYGGRNNLLATFMLGGRAAFSTGDVARLMEEVALVRPSMLPAPPSIWNKIYSEFKAALDSAGPQKENELLQEFSKLVPLRCGLIAVVGALISPVVLSFMQRCFRHCRIEDAYGITECGGLAFNNELLTTLDYRLESVPDMGFTTEDKPFPRGELLTRTPQMFSGYVNNPTETRAAFTDDGYFRTGDIVELRHEPSKAPEIRILDRKKNFFKLAQGQFVSPEHLQGVFTKSALIDQIYIHGSLLDDNVSAVIVPNQDRTGDSRNAIMRELRSIGAREGLRSHEIPAHIIIESEPFSVENGLLTPSMKPCRPKLAAKYADRLNTSSNIESRLKSIVESVTGETLSNDNEVGFLSAGGNSLTAVRLSREIQASLGVTVPLNALFEPNMNLKRLTELAQNPPTNTDADMVNRLIQDAQLDSTGIVGKTSKATRSPSAVFITGTTGYVGAFLLSELIRQYPADCRFICLVRCQSTVDPLARIRENLLRLHLWNDTLAQRIVPLRGDLAEHRFGLDEKTYETLARQIDLIFCCGATVNFVLPYSRLHGSNVLGTREIIRLATHTSHCVPVQYISTISVLSPGVVDELPIDQISPVGLNNGYGQSKWVAEKLMAAAHQFGLPVAIYRLGSMCADSRTGACNTLDINSIVVGASLKTNCYPVEAREAKLNTLPVDFAAESIVRLSYTRADVYGSVCHVLHPDGGVPFQHVVTGAHEININLDGVPFEQWRAHVVKESLESLDGFAFGGLFGKGATVFSARFYSIVPQQNIPPMNTAYVQKWLTFLVRNVIRR